MGVDESLVESIFMAALQQASPEQAWRYAEEACAGDKPLQRRVAKMLRVQAELGSFLQAPAMETVGARGQSIVEGPGALVGPYRLLEQIGEGGFGVVFMAEQSQPMHRMVALKIIKPGMDSQQVIARFEAERQALAMMDHPNIARVLDAGAVGAANAESAARNEDIEIRLQSSGRPYFVMELVRGVCITEYCERENVPLRERLKLFLSVCHAAEHAHQKGIIHRDLKPSNVLVTLHDGEPMVKVIDFGIAKAIGPQLTEQTLHTNVAHLMGTPMYMSPEQAALGGIDIDTRTDIYSLGVLLYELLTGTTAFEKERLRKAGYDEIRRMIREEEPPKPSTQRDGISCELDWIVMKAISKDRTRRYQTASALASDVQRYLKEEPIEARPPSAAYRFRKFAQRNRVAMTTVGLVSAALVLGTAVSTWQAVRARDSLAAEKKSRQDAEDSQMLAEANFRKARQAVDDMYTQVARKWLDEQPQMEPLQREFLEKALQFYAEFAQNVSGDPAIRVETARAFRRVADIQHKLGASAEAEQAYRQSIERWQKLVDDFPALPEHSQNLADALHKLGILLGDTGRYAEEEQVHRRALVLQQRLAADSPHTIDYRRDLARGHFHLGQALTWLRRRPEAEESYRRAIELQEKLAAEFPAVAAYRQHLAESHCYRGKLRGIIGASESTQALERAVDLFEQLAAESPRAPQYRNGLATACYWLAFSAPSPEAEQALEKALSLQRQLTADYPAVTDYRYDLVRSLDELGILMCEASRPDAAEGAYREALSIAEKLAAEAPTVHYHRGRLAAIKVELADVLRELGRSTEAETAYRESNALYEQLVAEFPDFGTAADYPRALISGYLRLGSLLIDLDTQEEAATVHRQALELATKAVELAPDASNYWQLLGAAQCRLGDPRSAIQSLQRAMQRQQGGDSFDWFWLARAHAQLGELDQARQWQSKAIEWMQENKPRRTELSRLRAETEEILRTEDVNK